MSQTMQIKKWLEDGNAIDPWTALMQFRCMRLSARIKDLRDMGVPIQATRKWKDGTTWCEYRLIKNNDRAE